MELVDRQRPPTGEDVEPSSAPRRIRVAQVLALVALLAAVVGAAGPAERIRTTYSWPPAALPAGEPTNAWYAPLLLISHRPEAIAARIPCNLAAPLPGSATQATVLATARRPEQVEGLAVRAEGNSLTVLLGDDVLDRVDLPAARSSSRCAYVLRLEESRWSLEGGPAGVRHAGSLEAMPKVTGLFSSLDLRAEGAPSIEVTTPVHATRVQTRQAFAWTVAVLAGLIALGLLVFGRAARRPWTTLARLAHGARANAGLADAVVFVVLLGWWVLSPAFWDDGWVLERADQYSSSGGFSTYYNAFGTNLPLDYWLEWGQHLLVDVSRALVFLRLPALVALAAAWILCRWILTRLLPAARSGGVEQWALASAFLAGALAWGMTMRPEPVIAVLAVAVLACMTRFAERGTTAPLAAVTVLVPFALTGHHSGVVALAPVLACSPAVIRWVRSHPATASTLVTTAIALTLVLLFVGADLEQRREETLVHQENAPSWRDEIQRYEILSDFPSGTPLRRGTVALMAIAVLAWLVRRRRDGALGSLPTTSLAVALLLLVATPSKWPWHFGALIGIAALAIANETASFREEPDRSHVRAWSYGAVGIAVVAAAWAWWPRTAWNAVDLRSLEWRLELEQWFPLVPLITALPLILLAASTLRRRALRRPQPLRRAAFDVGSWTSLMLAVPLIVFTVAVLVADNIETSSWTPARQHLRALRGDPRCGLGDDLITAVGSSVRPLTAVAATSTPPPAWTPPPPVAGLRRFALAPVAGGIGGSDWFTLPAEDERFGLFVAGVPSPTDRMSLEWGRSNGRRITRLGSDEIEVDFVSDAGAAIVSWRLVSASELPERRTGAEVVRVTLRSDELLGAAVAVTAPVLYRSQTLTEQLGTTDARSLVNPKLVTYFPCLRQPELRDGAVGVPQHVVASDDLGLVWPLGHQSRSPFNGILDLYRLQHLPLGDSRNPPREVFVYEVMQEIPGAVEAPPAVRRWSS